MGEVIGIIPRNKMERAIVAIARPSPFDPSGYMFAPMPHASIARIVMLLRRNRALRRRGKHTKAARRARARAHYHTAEVSR